VAAILDILNVSDGRAVQLDAPVDVWQIMTRRATSHHTTNEHRQKHGSFRVGWGELSTLPDSTSASRLDFECDVARISASDYKGHMAQISEFTLPQIVILADAAFSRLEWSRWLPCSIHGLGLKLRRSRETINEGGS
jgi:hypothetical protein